MVKHNLTENCWTTPELGILASVYALPPFSPLGHWKGLDQEHLLKRCDSVMDYNDPSRREYAQHQYTDIPQQQQSQPHQQYGTTQLADQSSTSAAIERFRPTSSVQESAAALVPTGRAGDVSFGYGWNQGTQYGAGMADPQTMQYSTDIQMHDSQRQPDSSLFSQYSSNILFPPGQTSISHQQSSQLSFDSSRYRDGPSGDVISPQFAISQPDQYLANQTGSTSSMLSDFKYSQVPSQYNIPPAFGHAGLSTFHIQDAQYPGQQLLGAIPAEPYDSTQYRPLQTRPSLDQDFQRYQTQIRTIFTHIQNKSLPEVPRLLLEASRFLLGNAEALGLTRDNVDKHKERLELWDEFNNTWLTLMQAQFDMTQGMAGSGQDQPILQLQELEDLGRELVRLNDDVEKDGLVDYQMGVAEERILDRQSSLGPCLWRALTEYSASQVRLIVGDFSYEHVRKRFTYPWTFESYGCTKMMTTTTKL